MCRVRLIVILAVSLWSLPGESAESGRQTLVVAHRGLLRHAPENTLANFRACLELRLGFEFDVQRTKDGQLVCLHDTTVDRTTDGSGSVAEMTLAEVRELDAGSWFAPEFSGERVPTVDEVLKLVASYRENEFLVAVDLKSADVGREVASRARELKIHDRLLFIGTSIADATVRKQIRLAAPNARTAAVANDAGEFNAALQAPDADWVYVRYLPSMKEIEQVRAAAKRTFIAGATVSGHQPENWHQATTVGITSILTDFPLELNRRLRKPTHP